MGLIPDPERSHVLQNSWAPAPQLLCLCSRVPDLQLLNPACMRAGALQQEKPLQWELQGPQLKKSPCSLQLEKSPHSNEDPVQPKWINKILKRNTADFLFFFIFFIFIFFPFIFISWRLITLQYCSGFCHTLTWISHGFTCIPHPDPPSHLPLHPIPLGLHIIIWGTPN